MTKQLIVGIEQHKEIIVRITNQYYIRVMNSNNLQSRTHMNRWNQFIYKADKFMRYILLCPARRYKPWWTLFCNMAKGCSIYSQRPLFSWKYVRSIRTDTFNMVPSNTHRSQRNNSLWKRFTRDEIQTTNSKYG